MSPEIRDVPSVITLDGPAGVGKSTTARRLAVHWACVWAPPRPI